MRWHLGLSTIVVGFFEVFGMRWTRERHCIVSGEVLTGCGATGASKANC